MKILRFVVLCAVLALLGCDKKEETPEPTPTTSAQADDKPAEAPAEDEQNPDEAEAPAKIEVAAAGAKLDPPVKPEALPEGAWYCDMGTVHWAAMEKPEDGKCPECGMMLKQYSAGEHAAQKENAVEAKGDDHEHGEGEEHDHEHGEDGHAH